MKKLTALILLFALALSLVSCKVEEGKVIEGADQPDFSDPTAAAAVTPSMAPSVQLPGDMNAVVMTIDGDEATLSEFSYQIASLMSAYEYYGEEGLEWGNEIESIPADEFFIREAIKTCKLFRAVERCAADNGFELSDEQVAQLDADLDEYIAQAGGEAAFEAQLADMGMTRELYEYLIYVPELYYHVYNCLYGEGGEYEITAADVETYFNENYLTTRHILKIMYDENDMIIDEEGIVELEQQAQDIRARIVGGEDFVKVAEETSDDDVLLGEAITFEVSTMPAIYIETTRALDVGEVSEVTDIDGAFVIIRREQLRSDYLYENYDEVKEEYGLKLFRQVLDPVRDSLTVERSADFDTLVDVDAIYKAFFAVG